MSFQIDGEEWIPETTNEHALAWIKAVNALLEENDARDSDGKIIRLSQNFANALYLQILAGSNRLADNDQNLQRAINSFNIELCDEQQIENLLPIAAITRNKGSFSTLTLTVTAGADGDCVIPAGTKAPYGSVNFVTTAGAIVPAGTTQNIETVCDTTGAVAVLSGEVSAFDVQIPNLESVVNNVSSVPGNAAETTESIRLRILRGQTIPYSIDGVKLALEELTGIKHARVYFNYNVSAPLAIEGGIVIQPRTAYIVVDGESDGIATTYASYMSAPTQNAPGASETGSKTTVSVRVTAGEEPAEVPQGTSFSFDGMPFLSVADAEVEAGESAVIEFEAADVGAVTIPAGAVTAFDQTISGIVQVSNEPSVPGVDKTAYVQNYKTASGQLIPIRYDVSESQTVFVRVILSEGAASGSQVENQIKRDLIAASAAWQLGDTITSLITSVPFSECSYTDVAYTQVSADGENWGNSVSVAANAIPRISDSTIVVEEL